jgi:nicotinic acid mononucleotide adenylyltransferase
MHRHSSSSSSSSLDQDKRHPNHDHLSNNLTEFLSQSIIDSSLKNKQQFKLSFAIAGGGSKAISSLTSTPGASAVFRNADILYDRTSFCQYISHHLTSQTSLPPFIHKKSLDRMPLEHYYSFSSSSTSSSSSSLNSQTRKGQTKFGFASRGSAILLSQAALHHAFEQCWSLEDMLYHSVAVGCTSTLVSHGREDRSSRAHISLLRGDGRGVLWDVQFSIGSCTNTSGEEEGNEKECEKEGQNGENKRHHVENRIVPNRRSRWEEEEVLAQLILLCVDQFASGDGLKNGERMACQNVHVKDLLNRMGDEWQESTFSVALASSSPATRVEYAAQKILDDNYKKGDILQEKYENRTDAIVLVPSYNGGSSTLSGSCSNPLSMVPLIHTVLPPDPLILPGSFNPPHMGHVALANAAIRAMTRKKNKELGLVAGKESNGGSNQNENDNDDDLYYNGDSHGKDDMSFILDSMWSTTENQLFQQQIQLNKDDNGQGPFPVLFEMSLTNADKPPMESQEASRRVSLFGDLVQEMNAVVEDTAGEKEEATERSSESSTAKGSEQVCTSMPKDWGVLLTNAPLFREKVRVLQKYLAPSGGGGSGMKNGRKMTFVIGTDTMVRILHPKYYGDLMENVIKSLREMKREGVHFVVGGRLEQIKNPDGTLSKEAKFVTGEQELKHLPADVVDMFTMIQEKDFRVDISSTELRAKKQSGLSK